MSYHVLHLTTPRCSLSTERGLLFCKYCTGETNIIALADIKAIIVATHGITFTNSCLAKLLENNVVILHCNSSYQPVGWSLPIERIVRTKVFYNQIAKNEEFENTLWKNILRTKVKNQSSILKLIGEDNANIEALANKKLLNEANIARQYWQKYFSAIGNPIKREHENAETYENICLNYGYAVIKTLIYRAVLIHGLLASLGIHHLGKYKSTPLVYDFMEVYRPFIDYYLYKFIEENEDEYNSSNIKAWSKYLADCLKNYRIKINGISYKIIDSVDIYVEKIVNSFLNYDCSELFLPNITEQYLHIDKHRNREYEE